MAYSISPHIHQKATIVDVGGGDGEPLNYLLSLRPDIKVILIDPSPGIGNLVKKEYLPRVELYPKTYMAEFKIKDKLKPYVILISDVIHHIPQKARKEFFSELKTMVGDQNEVRIIIKDIEPGFFRSSLSRLADRYISGDKKMSLIGRRNISKIMLKTFGKNITMKETTLFKIDKPNYALVFICKRI
ncbi:MAG TPA: class I SAM-dependent methyltransferase [Patescibacteria group bacterium]|nr:class I SAM-dependent methyltransferase [Patescibacteria group bacterium]